MVAWKYGVEHLEDLSLVLGLSLIEKVLLDVVEDAVVAADIVALVQADSLHHRYLLVHVEEGDEENANLADTFFQFEVINQLFLLKQFLEDAVFWNHASDVFFQLADHSWVGRDIRSVGFGPRNLLLYLSLAAVLVANDHHDNRLH